MLEFYFILILPVFSNFTVDLALYCTVALLYNNDFIKKEQRTTYTDTNLYSYRTFYWPQIHIWNQKERVVNRILLTWVK